MLYCKKEIGPTGNGGLFRCPCRVKLMLVENIP